MTLTAYEIDKATQLRMKKERKPLVCCSTCHAECAPDKKIQCFREVSTFLWWNRELGYYPKLHEHLSYIFWEPPYRGFISVREFKV